MSTYTESMRAPASKARARQLRRILSMLRRTSMSYVRMTQSRADAKRKFAAAILSRNL